MRRVAILLAVCLSAESPEPPDLVRLSLISFGAVRCAIRSPDWETRVRAQIEVQAGADASGTTLRQVKRAGDLFETKMEQSDERTKAALCLAVTADPALRVADTLAKREPPKTFDPWAGAGGH